MPDFSARIISGATRAAWTDPAFGDDPTRIFPFPGRPHSQLFLSTTHPLIVVRCTLADVEAPLDVDLAGELFAWWWVERPSNAYASSPPAITLTGGQSSEATIDWGAPAPEKWWGHWVLGVRRTGSGAVLLPFEVPVAL